MIELTVKIPASLDEAIARASAQAHVNKSELARRALEAYLWQHEQQPLSFSALDQAGDLVGCFSGGPADLSSNPTHLALSAARSSQVRHRTGVRSSRRSKCPLKNGQDDFSVR
jgi:hypothetical protein